ncbi:hypothetical protein MHLNE_15840 [Moorella humiferrea]|uniref:type II toxin-antitoxin system RelE/ParE family toxin n=1 Tax=Neomoorella humiferrea TaxID=676965 RepID=UPI0030CDF0E9
MLWTIEFYETSAGKNPVAEFLSSLSPREQAKIARALDLLREFGPRIGMPYTKHLEEGIWELRVPFGGLAFRLLYFVDTNRFLVVVHAFSKKTPKVPRKELDIAIARMKDYKQRKKRG